LPAYEITEWVAADGTVVNLMDIPNIGVQPGRSGAFMPPVRFVEDQIPYSHGARVKAATFGVRELDLPLFVKGATEDALRQTIRALLGKFDPLDDDGRLRVTRPDGTARELYCRYSRGGELVEDTRNYGITTCRAVITFRAANDPLWYDVNPVNTQFTAGAPVSFFPGTPFRLSSSSIFTTGSPITNDGDVETWPIWSIRGPATNLIIRNLTSGEKTEFRSTFALLTGETLTIDTRDGKRSITRNDGTKLYNQLTSDSSLWPIYKGSNTLSVDMQNTTVDSLVTLTYYRRFFSV
jgi:hypothetical protein